MDTIPVLNCFNGHWTVTHKKMVHLVGTGKCAIVRGPDGVEVGIEWLYGGYDAAQPGGSDPTRNGRNAKPATAFEIFDDFQDAEPGMPVLQFWTRQSSCSGEIINRPHSSWSNRDDCRNKDAAENRGSSQ